MPRGTRARSHRHTSWTWPLRRRQTRSGHISCGTGIEVVQTYLGLAIGDFVDPEPLVGRADQAGQVSLNILDVVQPRRERVVDVHDQHLPVGLTLVEQRHDAEHLDLLDLADGADRLANLAYVERVVVAVCAGLGVLLRGVFPSLGEGTVVPNVTWGLVLGFQEVSNSRIPERRMSWLAL
jgi:hypothetical protein